MKKSFKMLITAAALSVGSAAHATTIGSFTFDDTAFADDAVVVPGVSVPGSVTGEAEGASSAADGNFSTAANMNSSYLELIFSDNFLVNGPGDDLVVFTNTNNNVVNLSSGTDFFTSPNIQGRFGEFIDPNDAANPTQFFFTAQLFDLSDLGFADGERVSDGIFLLRGGIFSTVWDVVALNSEAVQIVDPPIDPPVSAVPLPGAGWILLAGLGGIAGLRRRRK